MRTNWNHKSKVVPYYIVFDCLISRSEYDKNNLHMNL